MISKTLSAPVVLIGLLAGASAVMAQSPYYDYGHRPSYGAHEPPHSDPRSDLAQRVARLERLLDSRALVDMLQRLDTLERDIQRLQGAYEVQDHRLDSIAQRQQALQADLAQQLRPEQGTAVDPGVVPALGPATDSHDEANSNLDTTQPGAASPTEHAATDPDASELADAKPADERTRYRHGFQLLRDGELPAAITALASYLQDYPQGRYAADARYWIADAHYVEQHYEQALRDFSRLVSEHPDSPKVPKALYKIGLVYIELQQHEQARRIFLELRQRYPGSTAARLAGEKLKGL